MNNQKELINRGRALYYGMFSMLFTFTYDKNRFRGLKKITGLLSEYPLTEEAGEALGRLKASFRYTYANLKEEYDRIFFDPESPIRTTASYYDEGYESGKKRVEMINYIRQTRFRKNEKKYKDTEDDFGFIFSFMYYLIKNNKNGEYDTLQSNIFKSIINPFADDFAESLLSYPKSVIFRDVAIVLYSFVEFERIFFNVKKPEKKKTDKPGARVLPYVNLKKTGKGKKAEPASCISNIEEEEAIEDDV